MDRNDCLVLVTSVLMLVWLWPLWKLWQSKGRKIEPVKKLRQLRARTPDRLYRLKTGSKRVAEVLTARSAGVSQPSECPW